MPASTCARASSMGDTQASDGASGSAPAPFTAREAWRRVARREKHPAHALSEGGERVERR